MNRFHVWVADVSVS